MRDVPRATAPAVLLALAGALFVVYPGVRPWGDSTPAGEAAAFASPAWLVAHLAAVAGFVLVGLAMRRFGRPAEVLWWIGSGLVLPYYGAEVFALHALGQRFSGAELAEVAEAIRLGPVAATVFATGLVVLAVAAVLVAVGEGLVAVPFAVAMVGFLPQFFAGPELRIAHGVLLGLGLLLLAARARRSGLRATVATTEGDRR
jgi:hypothetical protein